MTLCGFFPSLLQLVQSLRIECSETLGSMEISFTDNNAGLRELYFVPQEEESEFINPSARPRVYSHGHLM